MATVTDTTPCSSSVEITPLVDDVWDILITKGVVAATGLAPAKNPYPAVDMTKRRAVPRICTVKPVSEYEPLPPLAEGINIQILAVTDAVFRL